jgi:hypothetical protein
MEMNGAKRRARRAKRDAEIALLKARIAGLEAAQPITAAKQAAIDKLGERLRWKQLEKQIEALKVSYFAAVRRHRYKIKRGNVDRSRGRGRSRETCVGPLRGRKPPVVDNPQPRHATTARSASGQTRT